MINQEQYEAEVRPNSLDNPRVAGEVMPSVELTMQRHRLLVETIKDSKAFMWLAGIAVGATAVVALNTLESAPEPINFGDMEQVGVSDEGWGTILEAPDGTTYQGVWLDGSTGSSFANLGLNSEQMHSVLSDNGLETVPTEPTTIFVNSEFLKKDN